ncbi:MAG TPA: pyridoxamine 5'-phosphate oxidase [Gammaproteobacteria bacterium]|nr:pyridoxamine 5'-phosphate oxidase [Gammaproteobacteria bacterium]
MTNLNDLGRQYELSHLEEHDLKPQPLEQFQLWIQDAIEGKVKDPNAMVLSTVNAQGLVSSRLMLLKYFDKNGLVFFTNYHSPKAQALQEHPQATLLFWWSEFERQVRIDGLVEKLDSEHSDAYFQKRERESNIAAMLSKQSTPLNDKKSFIDLFEKERNKSSDDALIRPPFWGGYLLKPVYYEFWQGGPHRLHDRLVYRKIKEDWEITRLYP